MNKTFKVVQIKNRHYQLLTLPGTNVFTHTIECTIGAYIERILEKKYTNVYGISHLIEHLGFRATKDYDTETLIRMLKKEGTYNAATEHDTISYFFKTTMDRMQLATKLVCNYTFNDLTKISESEFELERKVVSNEVNRYSDDAHTMFSWSVPTVITNRRLEDTVIGIEDTVNKLTLADAIEIKDMFLHQKHIHKITYDPLVNTEEEVLCMVDTELDRWPHYPQDNILLNEYNDSIVLPTMPGKFDISSSAEQSLISIWIKNTNNSVLNGYVNPYISSLANTSLSDIIREKNGLTYGLYFYKHRIQDTAYSVFSCDTTPGSEKLLYKLFNESITDTADEYTPGTHIDFINTCELSRTLGNVNMENHNRLHSLATNLPDLFKEFEEEYKTDIEAAHIKILKKYITYDNMLKGLKDIKDSVNNADYIVARTHDDV